MKPLILVSTWYGPWPKWINFYMETCRANEDVDWLIVTDQDPPESRPPNVRFLKMSFRGILQRIGERIGLDLGAIGQPYKLCDLKPAYAHAFEEHLADYFSYGYADIDVFFGRIRRFYTDDVLRRYDVISSRGGTVAGHLTVFRNTRRMRRSYRHIKDWKTKAPLPENFALDERWYGRVFRSRNPATDMFKQLMWRRLFCERYATWTSRATWWQQGKPWPQTWLWEGGRLTNLQDDREYLYLHFMCWQSARHRHDGLPAPWPALGDGLVQMAWQDASRMGFVACPDGILPRTTLQRQSPPARP